VTEIAADAIAFQRQLVRDEPRTRAYAEAIRATVKPGDVVVDLGCGTGVLAMIARDAGARRVFAIEQSHLADIAALLAAHNGREIEVLHGWSFDVELPERANVLITETLSNDGLNEGILRSVLDARRRLLTDDARIIPQRIVLTVVPVEIAQLHSGAIASWSDPVLQLDFSPLRGFASSFMYGIDVNRSHFLGEPAQVFDIDLAAMNSAALSVDVSFAAQRRGTLHGLAVWFAATLAEGIVITNAPPRGNSHWGQAFMPIDPAIPIERGQSIRVTLSSHDSVVWRWSGESGLLRFDHSTALALTPCIART
jgi:SAM-dependent methyltransferase